MQAGRLDARILDLLRNIGQHRPRVTVLLTGVHALAELPAAWASTLVSTTSIEIGALDRHDAAQLVAQPVPGFPAVYSDPAIKAILHETACQPFLLQVLCSVLVDELNARRWRSTDPVLDADDVAAAGPAAIDRAENYLLDVWQDAVPAAARGLVRALARDPTTVLPVDPTDNVLVEAVLALERRHVITGRPGDYVLSVPLFARYVRSRQSLGA